MQAFGVGVLEFAGDLAYRIQTAPVRVFFQQLEQALGDLIDLEEVNVVKPVTVDDQVSGLLRGFLRQKFGADPMDRPLVAQWPGGRCEHRTLLEKITVRIDPARDFVGVYFSTNGYIPPYGQDKMPGYLRRAAKFVAGK